jgi:hypothetical protein
MLAGSVNMPLIRRFDRDPDPDENQGCENECEKLAHCWVAHPLLDAGLVEPAGCVSVASWIDERRVLRTGAV